jgi:hypothetical protein
MLFEIWPFSASRSVIDMVRSAAAIRAAPRETKQREEVVMLAGVRDTHRAAFALLCALLVAGCATQPSATLKQFTLGKGTSIATDARLRVVTNVEPGIASRVGKVDAKQIVCVEPSPDVAAAIAGSFGFGVSVLSQGAGSVSGANVEGLTQLGERTVAIQAILKQGYQACLDYANGAINGTTYSLRTSRLDDLLVTLVLAEAAAGAFGRTGATVGGDADSEARAALSGFVDALEDLDKARKDLADADKKVAAAKDEHDKAEEALAAKPDDSGLKSERDTKKAKLDAAMAERTDIVRRMSVVSESTTKAGARVRQVSGHGGIASKPDPEIAHTLLEMQEEFLRKPPEHAFIATCLVELGLWKADTPFERDYAKQTITRMARAPDPEFFTNKYVHYPVFLASGIEGRTRLAKHCEENLPSLMEKVRADRRDLEIRKLELKYKLADARAQSDTTRAVDGRSDISPMYAYNLLERAKNQLTQVTGELQALQVPPQSATFPATDRSSLVQERAAMLNDLQALAADVAKALANKPAIDAIQTKYVTLLGDLRRQGTKAERKAWDDDFALQQAEARARDSELKVWIEKLGSAQDKARELIALIQTKK